MSSSVSSYSATETAFLTDRRFGSNEPHIKNYLVCSAVTFIPIQELSPRADELIAGLEQRLSQRASNFSQGQIEQLEIQLEMLKDKNSPDVEIVVFPINLRPDG